jgi:hypothetical protein
MSSKLYIEEVSVPIQKWKEIVSIQFSVYVMVDQIELKIYSKLVHCKIHKLHNLKQGHIIIISIRKDQPPTQVWQSPRAT